jgi:peptidoglycan/xylan/chitin deacetylase (PgdA/CDA1 family)
MIPKHRIAAKLRSLLRRRRPRPAILMYHRVASVHHDPWGLAVSVERFEEQIAHLARFRRPMTMNEFVRRAEIDALPESAVAITFDDGYRDNLVHAKPILEKHSVPATVFLATGSIDGTSPFWWDELAAMILECERPVRHTERCAGEDVALSWGAATSADLTGDWRAADGAKTERQHAFLTMWRSLKCAAVAERDRVMGSLRELFEIRSDPLGMPMRTDDVRALLSPGLMTVGAHTVEHSPLTTMNRAEIRRELEESARTCRSLSGRHTDGFAYPYGDLDNQARDTVASAGFAWACSTQNAFVRGEDLDIFALPRIAVEDVPVERFKRLLTY